MFQVMRAWVMLPPAVTARFWPTVDAPSVTALVSRSATAFAPLLLSAISKMINMQELTSQLSSINQNLAGLSDTSAGNAVAGRVLLDELKTVKSGILRELRLDMREWELRRSMTQQTGKSVQPKSENAVVGKVENF